jgi:flagellar basal-body rod protein FlgF
MDRLIYSSLAALKGAQSRQTATANNLANAATPGFRAELSEAQTLWLKGATFESRAAVSQEVVSADMHAGVVTSTGRPLDVAIENDALLAVQSPDGEEAYTRRGDLQLSETGLLTTGDGRPVLGLQGPITLPPSDSVSIDGQGRISIIPAGGDPNQPQQVEQLKLVSATGIGVKKGLDALFRAATGDALPTDPDARVRTGQLEASNVSSTQALVDMIEASRAWDVQLKLLGDVKDLDAATSQLMNLNQ